jgi:hypothetical protein
MTCLNAAMANCMLAMTHLSVAMTNCSLLWPTTSMLCSTAQLVDLCYGCYGCCRHYAVLLESLRVMWRYSPDLLMFLSHSLSSSNQFGHVHFVQPQITSSGVASFSVTIFNEVFALGMLLTRFLYQMVSLYHIRQLLDEI